MCGIIGISSNKSVSSSIVNSLKKLEYRGYDSAGIATLSEGFINEVKSEGREIGRAHVRTPVTSQSRMPSSA